MSISIVIPAFNVEKYVAASLGSIEAQTIAPNEVIIIDDGSSDQTQSIIEGYLLRNPSWKLISTINNGQGFARNIGVSVAKSKYLYFFDADDLLHPNFLEIISDWISENLEPDVIFFSGDQFVDGYEGTEQIGTYSRGFSLSTTSRDEVARHFLQFKSYTASPCLYISKRSLWVKRNIYFSSYYHEDEAALLKLISVATRLMVSDSQLFRRRVRPGSTMTSPVSEKHVYGDLHNIHEIFKILYFARQHVSFEKLLRKRLASYIKRFIRNSILLRMNIDSLLLWRLSIAGCFLPVFHGLIFGIAGSNASLLALLRNIKKYL